MARLIVNCDRKVASPTDVRPHVQRAAAFARQFDLMSDRQFIQLTTKENSRARQAQHAAMRLLKRLVPERANGAIRSARVR